MTFNDIKEFTYVGNNVSVDGICYEVGTPLSNSISAVQFHVGRGYCIEEPLMVQVPLNKYENILTEWLSAKEAADNYVPEEVEVDSKTVGSEYVLNGVTYLVPFTSEDANGVVQVTLGFMYEAFTSTVIIFSNGTKLPLTAVEFQPFVMWFAEKRNSFFIE